MSFLYKRISFSVASAMTSTDGLYPAAIDLKSPGIVLNACNAAWY